MCSLHEWLYSTAHRQLDKRVRVTRVYGSACSRVNFRQPRVPGTRVSSARAREGTRKYSRLDSKKLPLVRELHVDIVLLPLFSQQAC